MCLLIHLVLKLFMYLLETANTCIMFPSFIRFELLSFEHGNPISYKMRNIILWLFCKGAIKFSFTQGYSISFPFIFMYFLRTGKQGGSKLISMP